MILLPQNSKLPSIPLDGPQSMLNLVKESTYKTSWTNPLEYQKGTVQKDGIHTTRFENITNNLVQP